VKAVQHDSPPMPLPREQSWRRRLAAWLQRAMLRGGLQRAWRPRADRGGTTILIYHSLADGAARPWIDPGNWDDPLVFEHQMRFLAAKRRVVSLAELAAALEAGRTLEPGSVAITFDDGYVDNYTVAAPILARLGLPATFFLATGYVDRGLPQWIDELWSIFRARTAHAVALGGVAYDLRRQRDVDAAYARIRGLLLADDLDGRDRLLAALKVQLAPAAAPPRLTLNWREVRELLAMHRGFDVGVHTREHVALPRLGSERIRAELGRCVRDVRERAGVEPAFFSFPYGQSSRAARQQVAAMFRAAVVTTPAALVHGGTDRFAMPRTPPADDARVFRFCTSGADPNLVRRLLRGA
jgi:peptidoglycan/xylan/chitin deacetylase (PgdA/CDA1 family)